MRNPPGSRDKDNTDALYVGASPDLDPAESRRAGLKAARDVIRRPGPIPEHDELAELLRMLGITRTDGGTP